MTTKPTPTKGSTENFTAVFEDAETVPSTWFFEVSSDTVSSLPLKVDSGVYNLPWTSLAWRGFLDGHWWFCYEPQIQLSTLHSPFLRLRLSDSSSATNQWPPESNFSPLRPRSNISDANLLVPSTFYLGAHRSSDSDVVFRSMDSVLFYINSDELASVSSTAFFAQMRVCSHLDGVIDIPDNVDVLSIILCVLYDVPCGGRSPSFNDLEKAIDRMTMHSVIPKAHILPSTHIHALLLSHALENPLVLYSLAAHHGLDDLATSASAHLLSWSLHDITDEDTKRMGPIYLRRLMNLQMQRTELLKRLLMQPPDAHQPIRVCGYAEQKKVSDGWMMVAAPLVWSARPGTLFGRAVDGKYHPRISIDLTGSQRPPMLSPFNLPEGILLLITDELAAPADFLLHRSLISHVKETNGPTKTIVLSVSEDLAWWRVYTRSVEVEVDFSTLDAVGHEKLSDYITEAFPTEYQALGYYSVKNAEKWLDLDAFMAWLSHSFQSPMKEKFTKSTSTPVASHARTSGTPVASSEDSIMSKKLFTHPTPSSLFRSTPRAPQSQHSSSPIEIYDSSDYDSTPSKEQKKRKRRKSSPLQEDCYTYENSIMLDTREWKDKNGDLMSMAAIIKSVDQDAWGGGSGGHLSTKKTPIIPLLDNEPCQVAEHFCQGIFHCDQLDLALLEGIERYEPDEDDRKDLFKAEREQNIRETDSMYTRAASFYSAVNKDSCTCGGVVVIRPLKKKNLDSHKYFIGCSGWKRTDPVNSHRFMSLPTDINDRLVVELFQNKGRFNAFPLSNIKKCAQVIPVRNGAKGRQQCPYTHYDTETGEVILGHLVQRTCETRIKIWFPVDRAVRQALIYLKNPHNHPMFPSTKLSHEGKELYEQAALTVGITGLTTVKCDSASSTKKIFGQKIPAMTDPALAIPRNQRKIIHNLRNKQNPHGTDIEGALYCQRLNHENLPPEARYIHEVSSRDGVDLIITMLPSLAARIHSARATLHDNTYKHVFGKWKEWEVVVWDSRLNMRVTVARIYCTHETREAFRSMWTGLWDTVEMVTKKKVEFKFIDGRGLSAILVDGCKPQVNACGDDLVKRIQDRNSPLSERDPQLVVQHIVRTCVVHLQRFFNELAKSIPSEVVDRVRSFPFLETTRDIEEFVKWCEESEYPKIKNWIIDKKSSPWFIPSINQYMSKIHEEDWFLTPGDTNLNESAHPHTNLHTGIGLPILEAIQKAYELDCDVEAKLGQAEDDCILPNNRNTKPECDHNNRKRKEARSRKATERQTAQEDLEDLDAQIESAAAAGKASQALVKELREKRKALQAVTGVKQKKSSNGPCGKDRVVNVDDVAESAELGVISDTIPLDHPVDEEKENNRLFHIGLIWAWKEFWMQISAYFGYVGSWKVKLGTKLGSKLAANRRQDHDLHPNFMKLVKLCPSNLAKVAHQVGDQVGT
ncbi:uncharacterized protein LACBIDRAFT_330283 [Laccaria bicolor S238N-H82]|uniref:Predicted protein n=1 Tax=Laccaria bicolor (strain S238N-H82 / ATCC MYA-4686) TaxID=486041 RepID=B0DKT4_LACBS|nr:uncharacterized protein LACBIDRAFT_330283 [Laccaria bicolor S238N-H82]EDR04794.1 predicted protein [Laccaria bicolor S238N-H82]|eukprot:XP_001884618.1 predicted protein [Laccaria bicolor S238N-H82]